MSKTVFEGLFTQQSPIPNDAIEAALSVLQGGRLHRYNTMGEETSQTALLEQEYAAWQGADYCLACASGGQAIQIALRASGVEKDNLVLTNAFTLAPVPGAIAAVGGKPVLVEINAELVIDLQDLAQKAKDSDAKYLLLSHMRGHLVDMNELMSITDQLGITVIEDCAHTMGATWNGTKSGNFGIAGCFSTQTYKHINSGEGGLLTSDDPQFMARAIMLSGSYMLYARHGAAPAESYFADARLDTPNMSARMDNLRAAILRPQLRDIDTAIAAWNERYQVVASHIGPCKNAALPNRPDQGQFVGSSIQFRVPNLDNTAAQDLVSRLAARGVEVKWFGGTTPNGFTSSHHSWRYVEAQQLPQSDQVMAALFDMRLPLSFSLKDCHLIGRILAEEIQVS
jgi:dTDP-4-amino-4,6-dideoxygalactose transaminase